MVSSSRGLSPVVKAARPHLYRIFPGRAVENLLIGFDEFLLALDSNDVYLSNLRRDRQMRSISVPL